MKQPDVQWLTSRPSGRAHTCGADRGQTGWRLHAVEAAKSETFADIGARVALCGLRPRHGWSLDLFIDEKCKRCVKEYEKRVSQEATT
jgi:hypothetical protein